MTHGVILSLGSVNLDIQVRAERWPEPGETMLVRDLLITGGGKAANVAWLARRLGAPAVLVARVGDDREAEEALRQLGKTGVDLEHVRRLPEQRTGLALIAVRPDGEKTILLAGNANDAWEESGAEDAVDAIRAAPEDSLLVLDLEVPPAVARRALEQGRSHGVRVLLDPSPADRCADDLLARADYLTPNPVEAERLVGFRPAHVDDAFRAADELRAKGARNVFVKLGGEGCVAVADGFRGHVAAPQVAPVDKTGAGDAFAGALAAALWEKRALHEAVRFAVAAATHAVTGYGSQPAYPDRAVLERMLATMA